MKNTETLYTRAKEYQDKRAEIITAYETRMNELEDKRGSEYFEKESRKAVTDREEALKPLKAEYLGYFIETLNAMTAANTNRAMTPPTEEELRLIQLLKLKEKPTEAELEAAANTLCNNATCLSILTEIAHKQGYIKGFANFSKAKEMPVDTAEATINQLNGNLRDFIEHDTSRAARVAQNYHKNVYGLSGDEKPLPKRAIFQSKDECFKELAGLSGDAYDAFCAAVDN